MSRTRSITEDSKKKTVNNVHYYNMDAKYYHVYTLIFRASVRLIPARYVHVHVHVHPPHKI